jgi:dephospho-CoA kinase
VSRALRVGVTGGIGSGKSALTALLEARGIPVVDADIAARRVVEPGSEALAAIIDRYGAERVRRDDGSLDRAALRRIVFDDPEERRWLETLTHPRIGRLIAEDLAAATSPYVILSSPLLLESSQGELVDHVVVVDVPESLQLARTMARDDNSEELVRAIMAAQLPRKDRLKRADTVIDNSGDLEALGRRAGELHERLLHLAAQRRRV